MRRLLVEMLGVAAVLVLAALAGGVLIGFVFAVAARVYRVLA